MNIYGIGTDIVNIKRIKSAINNDIRKIDLFTEPYDPIIVEFNSTIIVEPVVVIPDILSKKASVILKFKSENINGREPNTAILNQESAVNKKAWGKFNFLSWSKLDKKNNIPNIIVIIPELINDESNSLYINWTITGIIIARPKTTCNIPSVKNTVL